jgi:hypothetical protein
MGAMDQGSRKASKGEQGGRARTVLSCTYTHSTVAQQTAVDAWACIHQTYSETHATVRQATDDAESYGPLEQVVHQVVCV